MRRLLLVALALYAHPALGQTVRVVDDPRAEVVTLLFRIAGAPEFRDGYVQPYIREIDSTFAPYRDHPVFREINRLRAEHGLALSAVMSMPPQLRDAVSFAERSPIDAPSSRLGREWHGAEARAFLREARAFAEVAPLASFLAAHQALYDSSSARMRRLLAEQARLEWIPAFFGEPSPSVFIVSPLLVNASGNFAAEFRDGAVVERYAYVGIGAADTLGFPLPRASQLPTVVHEFNHGFVNPVIGGDPRLRASGEAVYRAVADRMRAGGYGSASTMLNESVVRAAVIRYRLATEGPLAAAHETSAQRGAGFVWMGELVELFGEYERSRDRYPTLASFVPRIASFYDSLAPRIAPLVAEFDRGRPSVAGTSVAQGAHVAPSLTRVIVRFDAPVDTIFHLVGDHGNGVPVITAATFDSARTTLTLGIRLAPDRDYILPLLPAAFVGMDGAPLREFVLRFSTRASPERPRAP